MICPLCSTATDRTVAPHLYACPTCEGVFRAPSQFVSAQAEKERYLEHNNDVNDPGYQEFVSPIVNAVLRDYTPAHTGLDFGSGTGPVITTMLRGEGYDVQEYDPFFHNDESALHETYDYIASCEVIEHFHSPAKEFAMLYNMLNPGGRLYCKTDIPSEQTDFTTWYYVNDPTHVFFYSEATAQWIGHHFGFATVSVDGRLFTFCK